MPKKEANAEKKNSSTKWNILLKQCDKDKW